VQRQAVIEDVENPHARPIATGALNAASTACRYTGLRKQERHWAMIDNLSLAISHGLMLLAAFLLLRRPDLDHEPGPNDTESKAKPSRWGKPGA